MFYLIDGYNLLHAMGVLHGRVGPTGLEKARLRLLGLLSGAYGAEASSVSVIFDAAAAPPEATLEQEYHGVHVSFATGPEQADGLIEDLIQHASAPKNLTVVSDDHRIQQAARHRDCVVQGCDAYMQWLERHRKEQKTQSSDLSAKPQAVSGEEARRWLDEFAELDSDPDFKELSDPFGFLESES